MRIRILKYVIGILMVMCMPINYAFGEVTQYSMFPPSDYKINYVNNPFKVGKVELGFKIDKKTIEAAPKIKTNDKKVEEINLFIGALDKIIIFIITLLGIFIIFFLVYLIMFIIYCFFLCYFYHFLKRS